MVIVAIVRIAVTVIVATIANTTNMLVVHSIQPIVTAHRSIVSLISTPISTRNHIAHTAHTVMQGTRRPQMIRAASHMGSMKIMSFLVIKEGISRGREVVPL